MKNTSRRDGMMRKGQPNPNPHAVCAGGGAGSGWHGRSSRVDVGAGLPETPTRAADRLPRALPLPPHKTHTRPHTRTHTHTRPYTRPRTRPHTRTHTRPHHAPHPPTSRLLLRAVAPHQHLQRRAGAQATKEAPHRARACRRLLHPLLPLRPHLHTLLLLLLLPLLLLRARSCCCCFSSSSRLSRRRLQHCDACLGVPLRQLQQVLGSVLGVLQGAAGEGHYMH